MTENPQPLPTQIAIPSQAHVVPPTIPVPQPAPARKAEAVEEEPYTIKCICNFSDDDGNTIYCETCDTWQHIECYYPNRKEEALREDFSHSCADCKPRPLDRQKAIERTRRLKNGSTQEDAQDKKPRRPPSKSHKKKPKPTDLQLNGHSVSQENGKHGSPGELNHPAKKAKGSHRPSNSVSSQANKRSPSDSNVRLNAQPPSPATSPPELPTDFEIHGYSDRFITLYRNEPETDPQRTPSNSFSSLAISNTMSLWLREPDMMRQETGESYNDVFQKLPPDISKGQQQLVVQDKQIPLAPDTVLRWKYLTTPAAIDKDVPLIELCGQILFQKDYCADPTNLWEELTSPLPFVFFHPMLPLCIDTRNEMSQARYVRRSCKPNAVLDTYLSNSSEYHFWLVSDRFVAANEQITLPWDFRLPKLQKARMMHLIGLGDDEVNGRDEPDMDEAEYQQTSGWLHRVLSEFGGCACDLGSNCAFARFHRHYQARSQSRSQLPKKKSRKPKVHTISPTSTGHAANSRAASESHNDDLDQDGRSTSERSKPPSRDRTPLRQGSLDQPGILTEPTEREKRKVQMVEDSFRRMEQQPPARKKKRTSDGTNSKPPKSKNALTSNISGSNGTSRYVDAGTSRSKSGSPASAHSTGWQNPFKGPTSRTDSVASNSRPASTAPRPKYCDASVQTDPVAGEWYSEAEPTPKPRRRIISLSQRLLNNRHRARCDGVDQSKRRTSLPAPTTPTAMEIDPPVDSRKASDSPSLPKESEHLPPSPTPEARNLEDVPMTDAPPTDAASISPTTTTAQLPEVNGVSSPVEVKSPELRVHLPPVPAFGDATSAVANVTTPQVATDSQAPLLSTSTGAPSSALMPPAVNGITHPSPVKKKLSLSDYTKSRLNKAASKPDGGPKTPTTKETKAGVDGIADAADTTKANEATETARVNGVSPTLTATDTPL
ncbi:SET domain-containing protein 3 like [Verticillium longisporum]|nr:SET domain-containing protein 3 like [Verticillium longisporum]